MEINTPPHQQRPKVVQVEDGVVVGIIIDQFKLVARCCDVSPLLLLNSYSVVTINFFCQGLFNVAVVIVARQSVDANRIAAAEYIIDIHFISSFSKERA